MLCYHLRERELLLTDHLKRVDNSDVFMHPTEQHARLITRLASQPRDSPRRASYARHVMAKTPRVGDAIRVNDWM
jgi:hypothetical protein